MPISNGKCFLLRCARLGHVLQDAPGKNLLRRLPNDLIGVISQHDPGRMIDGGHLTMQVHCNQPTWDTLQNEFFESLVIQHLAQQFTSLVTRLYHIRYQSNVFEYRTGLICQYRKHHDLFAAQFPGMVIGSNDYTRQCRFTAKMMYPLPDNRIATFMSQGIELLCLLTFTTAP